MNYIKVKSQKENAFAIHVITLCALILTTFFLAHIKTICKIKSGKVGHLLETKRGQQTEQPNSPKLLLGLYEERMAHAKH